MRVWGLDSGRPGEFMQVAALGEALGLGFDRVGPGADGVPPGRPGVILSFGRDALSALRLAGRFSPRPLTVHLGTPGKIPIDAFDLVIPMPQDDYPPAPNVLFLRLPLNGAAAPAQAGGRICTVILGGPSRHFRLPKRAVRRLLRFATRLAAANGEALQVIASPRTPPAVLRDLRGRTGFALHEFGAAPFGALLESASRLVVTADSASMLAEAIRSGAPVWLYALPAKPNLSDLLQRAADGCFGALPRHFLVRRGLVGGGTDFRRWHRRLEAEGSLRMAAGQPDAALRWAPNAALADAELAVCRARILDMLGQNGRS